MHRNVWSRSFVGLAVVCVSKISLVFTLFQIPQSSGKIGPSASAYPTTGWQRRHPLCLYGSASWVREACFSAAERHGNRWILKHTVPPGSSDCDSLWQHVPVLMCPCTLGYKQVGHSNAWDPSRRCLDWSFTELRQGQVSISLCMNGCFLTGTSLALWRMTKWQDGPWHLGVPPVLLIERGLLWG